VQILWENIPYFVSVPQTVSIENRPCKMMTHSPERHIRPTFLLIFLLVLFSQHSQVSAQDNFEESQILFNDQELPVITVTIDPDSLAWLLAEENLDNRRYLHASVHYLSSEIDSTVDNVGFRLRGNTSRYSAKKSFKISFNVFVEDREFYGLDKFNLNGEHNDPSIIRSKLAWDLCNVFGLPSSRAAHAKLYVNDEYRGLYIHVEEYDKTFLDSRFVSNDGNFFKCLWPADMAYLGSDPDLYKLMQGDRRVYALRTNEEEDDYSDLAHVIDVLNNSSQQEFVDSLESCVNTFDLLKATALEVLIGHWDDYWVNKNNYYLYSNPTSGKFEFVPYDLDNTYGILWILNDIDTRDIYQWGSDFEDRPLVDSLLEIPQYRNLYSYFISKLLDDAFSLDILEDRIYDLRDMIAEAAEEDVYRTLDYGWDFDDFMDSYTTPLGEHVTTGLLPYIETRNLFANDQLDLQNINPVFRNTPVVSYDGIQNELHFSLCVFDESELASVSVYLEEDPGFTEFDLVHSSTDTIGLVPHYYFEGMITLDPEFEQVSFYIQASDIEQASSTYPRHAPDELVTLQLNTLKINEFLASNSNINQDEFGEYDDWAELYNDSDSSIDLIGWFLTDDSANLEKWAFPDTTIEAGEHLLVWCDDDEEQGPLHTSFNLRRAGEYIGLSRINGELVTIVDSLTFDEQTTDVSFGRIPDGADTWEFLIPSPSATNGHADVDEQYLPSSYLLLETWPNPFNNSLRIRYSVPVTQLVRIEIHDVLGRKVGILEDGSVLAGTHIQSWEPDKLASGIYFIILKNNAGTVSKKVVHLK
jgi:CotH kinase protein/Lamin Tail Domain/Secretion system C-terminal sorting domain